MTKLRTWHRLNVELLEDRSVPTVTASVVGGSLVVKGDPTAASNVTITASDTNADSTADTFRVVDGATTVGNFGGVTKNVVLNLSDNNDTVSIDLKGLTTPGEIRANLGKGSNVLTLIGGTVKSSLGVSGGSGTDKVTLGGTTAVSALTVNGNAHIRLDGAIDDVLHLTGRATVKGQLSADAVNNITLDAGSTVGKSVEIDGGTGGNTVVLNGAITGSVEFEAEGNSTAGSSLTIGGTVGGNAEFEGTRLVDTLVVTGTIGGHLKAELGKGNDVATIGGRVSGNLRLSADGGNDTLVVTGTIGGNLKAELGDGNDVATIGGTVSGNLSLNADGGNDTLTLKGTVTKETHVNAGAGDDTLELTATAKLTGAAKVLMGAGADKFTLNNAAVISTLTANGGDGTDTFVGNRTRTGLTLVSFEL